MMPTDRLTMRSTTLASKVNEKMAAAVMLMTPAIVVASRMEMSVGSILLPLVPCQRAQVDARGARNAAQTGHFNARPG
ncbi:MAG: hypothetical protein V4724_05275 [Pseudomonadota bacterium]